MTTIQASIFSSSSKAKECKASTINKTMIIPVIDSLSITEYESKNGKLIRTISKPGFYNVIAAESIPSKATTLFRERTQVTGRSCKTIILEETCMTGNGIVTNKWTFENKAYIELPISCSIKSKEIKYGALKLTTDKSLIVEVGPTRMTTSEKLAAGENKVKIFEATFRENETKF